MNAQGISFREELLQSLLSVDRIRFRKCLAEILRTHTPMDIVDRYLVSIFDEIGNGLERGETSLAQIYMVGKLCEEVIPALLAEQETPPKNKVPLAIAVLQDHHILGKKIVTHALRSAGYHLLDYGSVPSPKKLAERALADGVRILLISVLMLPSALSIIEVGRLLGEKRAAMRIIVGGAPFNFDAELWKEVGADAMGINATESIPLVAGMLKEVSDE